nr:putative reverse transcriptase domain-containing protein [Tanacetum cinerariifolium]
MPPRMRTQSVGWPAIESLGGGTGVRVGMSGRGRRPRKGNDERVEDLNGQGNDQRIGTNRGVEEVNRNVSNRGNVGNQNGNVVNENVHENVRNVLMNGNRVGCSYKEFLACNLKEYDGKGGAVFLTRWIKKIENVQDISGCSINQKVKYTVGSFVSKALTWWNSQIRTLSQEVAISGALTDEAVRNGSIKKVEKRGNVEEPRRENAGAWPKCATYNSYHAPGGPCRTCFNCNRPGHLAKDFKGMHRNVNPINARNPPVRVCYECGSTDHVRPACPRLNREQGPGGNQEARQDSNIVTGTFTLNNYFATTLFDSGADYSFVFTTFIPLLGLELSDLGFKYEIELASGQLVEIDKVIKGCRLEIEGHVFGINLIPFGHGSFDVIIGMDWLSNHKAEIICHKKVVRIPLLDGKVLRVVGERAKEKAKLLMSVTTSDKKQEEIVVVRDFSEVFSDDLSGLPHVREIKFRIELIPGATPVAKSPYRLAPSE